MKSLGLASDLLSSSDQPLRHLVQIKEALYKSTQQSGGQLRDQVLRLISALQMIKSFGPFAVSEFLVDVGIIPEGSSRYRGFLRRLDSKLHAVNASINLGARNRKNI